MPGNLKHKNLIGESRTVKDKIIQDKRQNHPSIYMQKLYSEYFGPIEVSKCQNVYDMGYGNVVF